MLSHCYVMYFSPQLAAFSRYMLLVLKIYITFLLLHLKIVFDTELSLPTAVQRINSIIITAETRGLDEIEGG